MRLARPVSFGAVALSLLATAGCSIPSPNDAEIGCAYDPQSSPQCPGYEAGTPAKDASGPSLASDGAAGDTLAAGDGGAAASGLGNACSGPADCAGLAASYCLVSPTGSFPSFCTFTQCTEQACGASYTCCDCTTSSIAQLMAFPPDICVLPMTAAALPSYGCTCMPQAQ